MARQENEDLQDYLKGAEFDEDGAYRTRDGRIFETAMSYPDKLTVEEFIQEITHERRNQAFIDNMNHIRERDPSWMDEKQHAERWIQTYAAWMEMND